MDGCGKARLVEVLLVGVDGDDTSRAPLLHLNRIEPGVASDVENGLARQVLGNCMLERVPLRGWVVA